MRSRYRLSTALREVASILAGLVLGVCGAILLNSPAFKAYLRPILVGTGALVLGLIVTFVFLRIYLRGLMGAWSVEEIKNLISSLTRYLFVPEERNSIGAEIAKNAAEGVRFVMSVIVVTQGMAALFVLMGTCIAVATLATGYMQVERLDSQNKLIMDQNQYFRQQTDELRRQIRIQDEQGDLVRRKDLIEIIYEGKKRGLSMRTRIEALKALVRLDNKLIDRGLIAGPFVDLRGVDFSCDKELSDECVDFNRAWLVRTDFSGSNFEGAKLTGCDLRDSVFLGANLSGADLSFAELEGTQFREIIPVPLQAFYFDREALPKNSTVKMRDESFKELKKIYRPSWMRGQERRNLIKAEFFLERRITSRKLKEDVNRITHAANLEGARLSYTLIRRDIFPDLIPERCDQYARFPLGVLQEQAEAQIQRELDAYQRLDNVQDVADKEFGLYRMNIDMSQHVSKPNFLLCFNSIGRGEPGGALKDFENLKPQDRRGFIRDLCKIKETRIRGLLPFP